MEARHLGDGCRLTACSSWCPKYSPSCVRSSSDMRSRKKAATAEGLLSTVPEPMSAETPFTGSLQAKAPPHHQGMPSWRFWALL